MYNQRKSVHARGLVARELLNTDVSSSGSRISQKAGVGATSKVGVPTYYLAKFLPKTAWKWKNLDPRVGAGTSLASPLRSSNGFPISQPRDIHSMDDNDNSVAGLGGARDLYPPPGPKFLY